METLIAFAFLMNLIAFSFEPIQFIKTKLYTVLKGVSKIKIYRILLNECFNILNCEKCLSLWLGYFYFQNIETALIVSFLSIIVKKILMYD